MPVDEAISKYLNNLPLGKYRQKFDISSSINKTQIRRMRKPITKSANQTKGNKIKVGMPQSKEKFALQKRLLDLKVYLNEDKNPIPKFNKDDDEINAQTNRFNKINNEKKSLRELYFIEYEDMFRTRRQKVRTINLMQQFIYQTQYILPYVQMMRSKYISNPVFRIGFCFSMLHTLKLQQKIIYSTMILYRFYYSHQMFTHIRLYEKILRLDVDIKDIIKYIQMLHYHVHPEMKLTTEKRIQV